MHLLQKATFKNTDEKIIYYIIVFTYPLYLVGGLYLIGPILAWFLLYRATLIIFNNKMAIHSLSIMWILSILLIEAVVIIGSLNTGHSLLMIVKSSIGWAKGWALIGIFIFIGTILPIRYCLLQKAIINILWQSLIISPFLIAVAFLNFPTLLYISPLKIFGGGGEQFFKVWLYWNDINTGLPRWQLFAPWSPALAFYALLALSIILPRPSDKEKYIAIFSAVLLILLSESRAGIIILFLLLSIYFISYFFDIVIVLFIMLFSLLFFGIFIDEIIGGIIDLMNYINSMRSDSSMIRKTLNNIGLYRWYNESFWFGHGNVERGPHIVQFMPIGSHNTFIGLLFIKGIIGLLLYVIPLIVTTIYLSFKSFIRRDYLSGFFVIFIFLMYSFTENIEILSYVMWPGWLFIGMMLRACFYKCNINAIDFEDNGQIFVERQ
ncbi:O-antigen ligase family protein [Photobacterium toruni]|uniref:O-antigen ligase family protein n=1 Tax=Photobacterium toruni TaxID=1935446 RepID=UPI002110CBE0|nr:O-antigen ligase family protein [Photobacterium toruni]